MTKQNGWDREELITWLQERIAATQQRINELEQGEHDELVLRTVRRLRMQLRAFQNRQAQEELKRTYDSDGSRRSTF